MCIRDSSKRISGGSLVATSGRLVTAEQQVQGQGFEPIKGLFACGNNSGGRFPMGYNGIMNGVSIGMCLTPVSYTHLPNILAMPHRYS